MNLRQAGHATKDCGIASVSSNKYSRLPKNKFYCEPELKVGNSGVEDCLKY